MDTLLNFLKYFGLVIATVSSLVGITSDFKKEEENGIQKVTTSGKYAIILTLLGLMISALSSYLQDRKDETKAIQQISEDNKKQIAEIKRFQIEIENFNKISLEQHNLSRRQDSSSREANRALFKEQLESNKFLFKQMLVENYLETTPEEVDLVIEVPYNIRRVSSIVDSCRLKLEWSSNFVELTKQKKRFHFSGVIRRVDTINYFVYETTNFVTDTSTGKIDLVKIEHSTKIALKKKNNAVTYLILPLIHFNYSIAPWGKVMDFRTNDFSFEMTKFKKRTNFDFSNKEQGGTPFNFVNEGNGLVIGYIRFDNKYILKLSNYDVVGKRKNDMSEPWKDFVENILSTILN